MCIKFFCNDCGKEIYENLDAKEKEIFTISMFENICYCKDCSKEITKNGKHKVKKKIEKQDFLFKIVWINGALRQ